MGYVFFLPPVSSSSVIYGGKEEADNGNVCVDENVANGTKPSNVSAGTALSQKKSMSMSVICLAMEILLRSVAGFTGRVCGS